MTGYIPIYKKIINSKQVLINRSLPVPGDLIVGVGDVVEPFAKLGGTKISKNSIVLPENIRLAKRRRSEKYISLSEKSPDSEFFGRSLDIFFYKGDLIGRVGIKKVIAPFNGVIYEKEKDVLVFREEKSDFWLLSGVWGRVKQVVPGKSVLIQTQTLDIHMAACTNLAVQGELIIFPNPSELLEMHYLEKFTKDLHGKILYIGDFVSFKALKKASEMGAAGVIAGSAERKSFSYAIQNDIFLGVFSGFGRITTPEDVYESLKNVSNRYVFVHGDRNLLRIPLPFSPEESVSKSSARKLFRQIKKGARVMILGNTGFGHFGEVVTIQDGVAHVKLDGAEVIEVSLKNLFYYEKF